jgi:phytoene/squalene synthetase
MATTPDLAAAITRAASKQTYYIVRCLVDRDRVTDAYHAYAYFRWVDDWLDQTAPERSAAIAFVQRQRALVECCYQGTRPYHLSNEESLVADLIGRHPEQNSGLRSYVNNMLAVMAFDAGRRGRLISQQELANYSRALATAVTEALHYFIGHDNYSPRGESRYLAAAGAHVAHMLRDAWEDTAAGYYNIPSEFLATHDITPQDIGSEAYRLWVKSRVQLARTCFREGKAYLAQVANRRCRIAGYTYMMRFERVLGAIERDDYRLRSEYAGDRGVAAVIKFS